MAMIEDANHLIANQRSINIESHDYLHNVASFGMGGKKKPTKKTDQVLKSAVSTVASANTTWEVSWLVHQHYKQLKSIPQAVHGNDRLIINQIGVVKLDFGIALCTNTVHN